MDEHIFADPISGEVCTLVLDPSLMWWAGGVGVRHARCESLADVSPDLDAFFCASCKWNGRVTGAWVCDMWDCALTKAGA